jgi:hypothetical protein
MTTDNQPNPSNDPATDPATFPPNPTQLPAEPGLPERAGDEKIDRVDQVADHMAHKGAKAEQAFDTENNQLFSK